jgi:signal transduction histidine kinase
MMTEGNIVIAVNDTGISQNIKDKLLDSGYSVIISPPKKEAALANILKNEPALIIISPQLDSNLSGIDLIIQLKDKIEVPTIFVSTNLNDEAYKKAKALNPIAYFTYPFNIENLFYAIEIGLDNFDLQKKANALLLKSLEGIKENNNSKDKFMSIISHDLRNPFNSLLGLTELLAYNIEDFTQQEIKESAISLNLTVHKLFNLLTNLLEWSKLQAGNFTIEKSEFQVSQILNYIFDVFSDTINTKQITVLKETDCEITIFADRTMIETAIKNIIFNAVRFTRDGGTITISCRLEGNIAKLFIKDNGIGIAKEDQERLFIFEKRFSTEDTNNEKGTGFGLLLSKEFVEKNGGFISFLSEPNHGSTFIISLPTNQS